MNTKSDITVEPIRGAGGYMRITQDDDLIVMYVAEGRKLKDILTKHISERVNGITKVLARSNVRIELGAFGGDCVMLAQGKDLIILYEEDIGEFVGGLGELEEYIPASRMASRTQMVCTVTRQKARRINQDIRREERIIAAAGERLESAKMARANLIAATGVTL